MSLEDSKNAIDNVCNMSFQFLKYNEKNGSQNDPGKHLIHVVRGHSRCRFLIKANENLHASTQGDRICYVSVGGSALAGRDLHA